MQLGLFGQGAPSIDHRLAALRITALSHGAWIGHATGWLAGHDALFRALLDTTAWRRERMEMYGREVEVPRLVARIPDDGPGHPVLHQVHDALEARLARALSKPSMALYRDGRDSVAWHGDRLGTSRNDAIVAVLSLGGRRRFGLRPAGGGRSRMLLVQGGDLLVMGGTCQLTWQHAVPKMAHADPRISVQFRSVTPAPRAAAPADLRP